MTKLTSISVSMPVTSAGLLMYRLRSGAFEVLLAHPGGPFFKNKDQGAWSIPKGLVEPGEELLQTACREFFEETQLQPAGPFIVLPPVTQKGGKVVHVWAFEGDCDPHALVSNSFTLEWPPRSGKFLSFPENDRAEFFAPALAKQKINIAQAPLIDQLAEILALK